MIDGDEHYHDGWFNGNQESETKSNVHVQDESTKTLDVSSLVNLINEQSIKRQTSSMSFTYLSGENYS